MSYDQIHCQPKTGWIWTSGVFPWAMKEEVAIRDSKVCYVLWFTVFTFNQSCPCSVTQCTLVQTENSYFVKKNSCEVLWHRITLCFQIRRDFCLFHIWSWNQSSALEVHVNNLRLSVWKGLGRCALIFKLVLHGMTCFLIIDIIQTCHISSLARFYCGIILIDVDNSIAVKRGFLCMHSSFC